MIPAPFEYALARSTGHAIELLGEFGEGARVLSGGHALLPMMKLRLVSPSALVDVGRLDELAGVSVSGEELVIGANTTLAALAASSVVRDEAPLLAYAASRAGDAQVRRCATLGGSLAHADPAADLPMVVVALGGSVDLVGPGGRRVVAADDFFTGFLRTVVRPQELVAHIRLPRVRGAGWGYQKLTRRTNDWAIVGVAVCGGRVALANMGPTPLRARQVEQAIVQGAGIAEAAGLAAEGTHPVEDIHADADYRRHLARVLTRRALAQRFCTDNMGGNKGDTDRVR